MLNGQQPTTPSGIDPGRAVKKQTTAVVSPEPEANNQDTEPATEDGF